MKENEDLAKAVKFIEVKLKEKYFGKIIIKIQNGKICDIEERWKHRIYELNNFY